MIGQRFDLPRARHVVCGNLVAKGRSIASDSSEESKSTAAVPAAGCHEGVSMVDHVAREHVRYAVVGLGHISQVAVLPAFKNAGENSKLTALVSDDPVKLKELAK